MIKPAYITKDWNDAALLFAKRISFLGVHREGDVCFFEFQGGKKTDDIIEANIRGELMVNVRDLVDSQRRVKDLIHRNR